MAGKKQQPQISEMLSVLFEQIEVNKVVSSELKTISEKLNLDMYLGGATSQGFYHGYDIIDGQRYEPKNPWNRSGELIPYKIGVALSYKIN